MFRIRLNEFRMFLRFRLVRLPSYQALKLTRCIKILLDSVELFL